jgi:hypothetical protein
MRSRLPLVLILACLATLIAPLRTSWACADGTQCVLDEARRFVCPGGACSTGASCCLKKRTVACKHGAFPSAKDAPTRSGVQSPDHCRFSVASPPNFVGVVETSAPFAPVEAALPVMTGPDLSLPEFTPAWRREYSLGYRPPPHQRSGPSRAPPTP